MDGLAEQAEEILEMPARVGYPIPMESNTDLALDPTHATALGLLRYGLDLHGASSANGAGSMLTDAPGAKRRGLVNWLLSKIT